MTNLMKAYKEYKRTDLVREGDFYTYYEAVDQLKQHVTDKYGVSLDEFDKAIGRYFKKQIERGLI